MPIAERRLFSASIATNQNRFQPRIANLLCLFVVGTSSLLDRDRLDIRKFPDAVAAQFAPVPGTLNTSKRQSRI